MRVGSIPGYRQARISLVILLALAGEAWAQGVLKAVRETGPRDVRINIVILAEGYTASQQSAFDLDATKTITTLLADPFYASYAQFFNAYSIFVASNEAGADDPSTNTYVDTYFNSTFGSFGIDRLLTIPPNDINANYNDGQGKVFDLLASLLPDYDVVVLLVNDSEYGGSGGPVAVASTNALSSEIAIHELGHTIVHLGDEYSDPYPGFPDTEEPNTTTQTNPNLVKWRAWFVPGTPYPTPPTLQFASIVGLFEGAHFHATGWFRPQLNCKMRTLGAPFCKVCLEAAALSFYDLSPPIDSVLPVAPSLDLITPEIQSFVLTLKEPVTPLSVKWAVDGNTLPLEVGSTLALETALLPSGPHTVDVLTRDVSGRIRTDSEKLSQETRSWRIDLNGPTALSQPVNISTRGNVLTGENVLIGGFIIGGTAPKKLIIRALGPSLQQFGITNALSDPILQLLDSAGEIIATNDNWRDTQQSEIAASGFQPPNDKEPAISITLPVGAYTAIVRGNNATGIALVEVYDVGQAASSDLTNISTRGFVQGGERVLIGGFILGKESGGSRIVVRVLGPSLSAFGVSVPLQDPMLDLYNSSGTRIAGDNDWKDTQEVAIQASGLSPKDTREAAIMSVLPPGAYTAIVRGNNNTSGVALVEVYNLH
jgi:IgA Peptidase M64